MSRYLMVIADAYLLSGIMLAPIYLIATTMHVHLPGHTILVAMGWGAAAIVAAAFLIAALT